VLLRWLLGLWQLFLHWVHELWRRCTQETSDLRTLILCNKTDSTPCPLPQIAGLGASDLFLAGSAQRGTNMPALWRRVEACAAASPALRRVVSEHLHKHKHMHQAQVTGRMHHA